MFQTIIEPRCMIRGDFTKITIGVHCIIAEGTVIRSPQQRFKGSVDVAWHAHMDAGIIDVWRDGSEDMLSCITRHPDVIYVPYQWCRLHPHVHR